jgi:hypothetical protein
MKKPTRLSLALPLCVLSLLGGGLIGLATAQPTGDAVEQIGPGFVNWTARIVTAVGTGSPPAHAANSAQARAMAERAATVVAQRNLLEVVQGVRVDAATLVENHFVQNDVVRTRVTGIIKGARPIKIEHLPDGSVEVTVGIALSGELADAVLPKEFGRRPVASGMPFVAKPPPPPVPVPPTEAPPSPRKEPPAQVAAPKSPVPKPSAVQPAPAAPAIPSEAYTGLIVDARGLGLKPALVPRLYDEQGRELYVGDTLSREQAVQNGVAGYSKDLVAASRLPRVTDNPLIVKGIKASGNKGTDIVLGEEGATRIKQTEAQSQYLKQARVVVVYD